MVQRSDDFVLSMGSTVLASGTVAFNSVIGSNRSNPAIFSSSAPIAIRAGQQITLVVQRSSNSVGALAGLRLSITLNTLYFPQLALSGGWQTTLTYVNYSPQTVRCSTTFYSDSGGPLLVPFSSGAVASRTDALAAGQSLHVQTTADLNSPTMQGWAQAVCDGPIQASLLYRLYQQGIPAGEAGVNASAPATKFVTFAETKTGVAYANPSSTQSATVTFTVINSTGIKLASSSLTVGPLGHGAANLGPLLGLQNFMGFVEITSTAPIISLSLNAEAFPSFSSLPPGALADTTPLVFQ